MTVHRCRPGGRVCTLSSIALSWLIVAVAGAQSDTTVRRQYDSLLVAYQDGGRDSGLVIALVEHASALGDDSVARMVSRDYLNSDLGARPLRDRLTKASIDLARRLTRSSSDSGFGLFYRHDAAVDSVMGHPGFAASVVSAVIQYDIINPRLLHGRIALSAKPDWGMMRKEIDAIYGRDAADRAVLDAQFTWYRRTNDWPNVVQSLVAKIDRFGLDTANADGVNDLIYNVIFEHSRDASSLRKAIGWMAVLIRRSPKDAVDLDTYANLLYKIGRPKQALPWEAKAAALTSDEEVHHNLAKMRRGDPTWRVDSGGANTNPAGVARKPAVNFSTPETWPRLDSPEISNDGQYVAYVVTVPTRGPTLSVRAVDRPWQRDIPTGHSAVFTEDSRRVVFRMGADSLGILSLGVDSVRYIRGVRDFATPRNGDGRWLAYQLDDSERTLVLQDLHAGVEHRYAEVASYRFSDDGKVLVMQAQRDSLSSQLLMWVEPATGRAVTIGRGRVVGQWMFDETQVGLAYLMMDSSSEGALAAVRYYAPSLDSARIVVDSNTPGMTGLAPRGLLRVGTGGERIFLWVGDRHAERSGTVSEGRVRIQSTRDEERTLEHNVMEFPAVTSSTPSPHVVRFARGTKGGLEAVSADGAYAIVEDDAFGRPEEYRWRITARPNVYLVATRDGERTLLRKRFVNTGGGLFHFSPTGHWVIWYDPSQQHWYTYDVVHGVTRNITRRIRAEWAPPGYTGHLPRPLHIIGWLAGEDRVVIESWYDIWAVDPAGRKAPMNLTGGVGARQQIRFRWIDFRRSSDSVPTYRVGDTLILAATDERTKANGFYRLVLGREAQPTRLRLDAKAYASDMGVDIAGAYVPAKPLKARNAARYIVTVESATEYPNYNVTSDFRDLTPITSLAPQLAYNWCRTELVHWRLPDGRPDVGILYKPEDFDPHQRYPVIIYYYESNSAALNYFVEPGLSNGTLPVAWFVSHGYVVFVPDIPYVRGAPGRSALDAVVSGAAYLAHFPWVNAHKIGIQGHSFGGFETYDIVTHTSRFAAAAAAEGVTDVVSDYLLGKGPWYYEVYQGRIGASLWERPDYYIENSAIFSANRVATPLLMLANTDDPVVSGRYGREMFVALERLGKTAWLLDYPGQGHTLEAKQDQLDYSIRLGQFFDYYLKDAPPPKWMTTNASDRRSDASLELDTSGARP